MASGPLFLMVLEKNNAIADLRKLMGATNPANADEGTIRKKFAQALLARTAIHGIRCAGDPPAFEIAYWTFAALRADLVTQAQRRALSKS